MKVIIAGLETRAGLAYMGEAFALQYDVEWYDADEFIDIAQEEPKAKEVQWVWLYLAPWALLPDTVATQQSGAEAVHRWEGRQRRILQLRRYLRKRLILVNAARVDAHELARHLRMATPGPLPSRDKDHAMAKPMAVVLGRLFEQIAPDYWTLYEALEAVAWLPEGKPELRSDYAEPSGEGLEQLLDVLYAGQQLPYVLQRLQNAEIRGQKTIQDRESGQRAEPTAENAWARVQQLTDELDAVRDVVKQAEQRCSKLQQERDALEARLANSKNSAKAAAEESGAFVLQEENELLVAQLQQVQEELESHYLANHQILTIMEQSEATMDRARTALIRLAHG